MGLASPLRRRPFGRRTVLALGAGLVAAALAAAAALRNRTNRYRLKSFVRATVLPEPRLDETSPVGVLTDAEVETIVALAAILVPPGVGVAAAAAARPHVERRAARDPGYLAQYRRAALLLDGATERTGAGSRFADASPARRQAALEWLLWSYPAANVVSRSLESVLSLEPALALRRFVIADLLAAFYSSADGWAVVGYPHFPGVAAADPLDYTRPIESRARG